MPLSEVKSYISTESHLPRVPSAEEVAAYGAELSEMNALLLQKIEELTLYIIDQDEKYNLLAQKLAALEAQLAE